MVREMPRRAHQSAVFIFAVLEKLGRAAPINRTQPALELRIRDDQPPNGLAVAASRSLGRSLHQRAEIRIRHRTVGIQAAHRACCPNRLKDIHALVPHVGVPGPYIITAW